MSEKLRVGILGATGMVGQRFISLLENHPFFMRKGSGTFFVYRKFCDESTQSGKQEQVKAGYHHDGGALPFTVYLV